MKTLTIQSTYFRGKRANLAAAAATFVNNPYQSPRVNSSGILTEIVKHMNILRVRVHYPHPYTDIGVS